MNKRDHSRLIILRITYHIGKSMTHFSHKKTREEAKAFSHQWKGKKKKEKYKNINKDRKIHLDHQCTTKQTSLMNKKTKFQHNTIK